MGLLFFCCLWHFAGAIQVKTNDGVVEGDTVTLFNGRNINIFYGIPFAAPPTGKNRFAPPQAVQPWNGTLQAKSKRDGCMQAASDHEKKDLWFVSDLPESEDCLYLNLWVPKTKNKKLAVMVWIFSGGFSVGSANLPIYDGGILASEQNVIVVTINYRVSLFGFAYLNSSDVPGNMGLQDQIQAIQWVNDNIGNFGGDKKRITLFGQSAGSGSVGFHLTNPKMEGLFQNGIMESGSINTQVLTTTEEQALSKTRELARSVNCLSSVNRETVRCLRSKSTDELLANYRYIPYLFAFVFPAIKNGKEVPFDTNKVTVPDQKRKNLLGGDNTREISYVLDYVFPGKKLTKDMFITEDDLRGALKNGLGLSEKTFQDLVISLYKNYQRTNQTNYRIEASEIITDITFYCPQIDFTKAWVSKFNQVYYYNFNYKASVRQKRQIPKWVGPVHGEEVPFVFGAPLDPRNGYTKYEMKLSKEIMILWSNFAKTGNPNCIDEGDSIWPKLVPGGPLQYLDIGKKLRARTYLKERECDFWINIFPAVLKIQAILNGIMQ